MRKTLVRIVIESAWIPHCICCLLALIGCIPLLWPELASPQLQASIQPYAGPCILGAATCSAALLTISCVRFLLRMQNLRALGQLVAWAAQWGIAVLIFIQMSIEADIPSPYEQEEASQPIQQTATLHTPTDKLTGPAALAIPIEPDKYSDTTIEQADSLVKLEREHEELLADFLSKSPRWAFAPNSDTFYTQPGHVVLVPPATGGIPGTVHACFRSVTEGERLPAGFIVATPGSTFPETEDAAGVPDIALELSGKHYLLLAWRGTKHRETACKALNAAIAAIDSRMQRLAESPTPETAAALCEGKRCIHGNKPELRVNEPNGQYGVYQAVVYANTGVPGTLLLVIRDTESGQSLRVFSFPSRYSNDPDELFRHDIPGTTENWMRDSAIAPADTIFPQGAPYFAIRLGESHQYFGVTFEVQFVPRGSDGTQAQLLLRRNYTVQAYESAAAE